MVNFGDEWRKTKRELRNRWKGLGYALQPRKNGKVDLYKIEPDREEIEKTIMTANYSIFTMRVTNSDHIIDTVFLSHN